jgi:hypothetical protein
LSHLLQLYPDFTKQYNRLRQQVQQVATATGTPAPASNQGAKRTKAAATTSNDSHAASPEDKSKSLEGQIDALSKYASRIHLEGDYTPKVSADIKLSSKKAQGEK